MSRKEIPIYTVGDIGEPSVKVTPNKDTVYVSAYTGAILASRPTFKTPTDDPTGKNIFYHGAIMRTDSNTAVAHHHPEKNIFYHGAIMRTDSNTAVAHYNPYPESTGPQFGFYGGSKRFFPW